MNEQKAEQLRKMFFAIAEDVRVILIELAARIDGLNKISALPPDVQKLYSTETLQIFVPICYNSLIPVLWWPLVRKQVLK